MTTITTTDADSAMNLWMSTFRQVPSLLNAAKVMRACKEASEARGYKLGSYYKPLSFDDDVTNVTISLHVKDDNYDDAHNFNRHAALDLGVTRVAEVLQEAVNFVHALPNLIDWKRAKWREEAVALQKKGEDLNIGFEYTVMLKAMVEKLSTNIITAPSVHNGGVVQRGPAFPAFSDGSMPDQPESPF